MVALVNWSRHASSPRFAVIAVLIPLAATVSAPAGPPDPGETAPAFVLTDLDGKSVRFPEAEGQVTSITFFAVWCEPCVEQIAGIERAAARYRGRGYRALLVAVPEREDVETLRDFVEERGLDLPVLLDAGGTIGTLYGVTRLPHSVIVARDGAVRFSGDFPSSPFVRMIGDLLAEKTP